MSETTSEVPSFTGTSEVESTLPVTSGSEAVTMTSVENKTSKKQTKELSSNKLKLSTSGEPRATGSTKELSADKLELSAVGEQGSKDNKTTKLSRNPSIAKLNKLEQSTTENQGSKDKSATKLSRNPSIAKLNKLEQNTTENQGSKDKSATKLSRNPSTAKLDNLEQNIAENRGSKDKSATKLSRNPSSAKLNKLEQSTAEKQGSKENNATKLSKNPSIAKLNKSELTISGEQGPKEIKTKQLTKTGSIPKIDGSKVHLVGTSAAGSRTSQTSIRSEKTRKAAGNNVGKTGKNPEKIEESAPVSKTEKKTKKGGGQKGAAADSESNTTGTEAKKSVASKKSADKEPKEGKKTKKNDDGGTDKATTGDSKTTEENRQSKVTRGSEKSKKSGSSSKGKGKKKGKGKEKVKKLNRKAIYKDVKMIEKKIQDEEKRRKKLQWEKNKVFFYWNCVVGKLIDLGKRNHQLKKKQESLKMEKKDAMFHEYWKKMNETRMDREEMLDKKRNEFRSMITELRDNQKKHTDWLFKDIQTYVKDTYLVGQKYTSDVVGIRMEYTKGLTETLFEARENSRILEIEQNVKYGPAMEEFEEQMRRLRSRIPTERQERLQKMLAESNEMLVELVNVYTNILHHNFIEVCHTANIINALKTRERRLERERNDLVKRRNKIKERTEYLHDRVSNLKRQVNAGKEARKKLHRVMKEQEALQSKKDISYINKELTYQENAKLNKAFGEMCERVNKWYFQVKRFFLKSVLIEAGKFKERALQLANYNRLVKNLFDVEDGFLETIDTFKDHEEFEDTKAGLKVLLGSFKPFTLADLEKEFEGCTESFATAIIFFKRRLSQNYLSLDDLHFFIKRRSPLSFLEASRKEEKELGNALSYIQKKKLSLISSSIPQSLSAISFRL